MSEVPKPIIVVHPIAATKAVKDHLRRAGYAVLVGEAEHFKTLEVLPVASLDLISKSALRAVLEGRETARFGHFLATALLKEPPKP